MILISSINRNTAIFFFVIKYFIKYFIFIL